jgi:integrase
VFNGVREVGHYGRRSSAPASTWRPRQIGIPELHPHELRHTAASLAIACGADVKVVQQAIRALR